MVAVRSMMLACDTLPLKHRPLPFIAYELLARLLPSADLPAARLACKEFAAALDSRVQSINVGSWPAIHKLERLQHVRALSATVQTCADWQQMQQLAAQLPKLAFSSLKGRRTWQQMNSTASSASECRQLHSLQAASFEGIVKGLEDIAALAPNLQHLYCAKLIITVPLNVALPAVTHLGSSHVQVEADGPEEGGQLFANAFPSLKVIYQTPEFTFNELHSIGFQRVGVMSLRNALAHCTNLQALRVLGDSTTMYGMLPGQLRQLQNIKRLAVYGIGPAAELKGIGKLQQLQHLWLTFLLPAKKAASQLLRELLQLQQLQSLALPAKLLCRHCCPSMQQLIEQLASNSSIVQLMFLRRRFDRSRRKMVGDFCPHVAVVQETFTTLAAQHTAVAVHNAVTSEISHHQQQKKLLLLQLEPQEPAEKDVSAVMQHLCCTEVDGREQLGSPTWGLLGPFGPQHLQSAL